MKGTTLLVCIAAIATIFFFQRDAGDTAPDESSTPTLSGMAENTSGSVQPATSLPIRPHPMPTVANTGVQTLEEQAARGDARAQRELSGLFEFCMFHSISPDMAADTARHLASRVPGGTDFTRLERTIDQLKSICAPIDADYAETGRRAETLLEEAAANDDLVAQLRLAARGRIELEPPEKQALILSAIKHGGADELWEMAPLMRTPSTSLGVPYELTGPIAEHAWSVVACRMGASACSSLSAINLCLHLGRCSYNSHEEHIWNDLLPPSGQIQANQLIAEIHGYLPTVRGH